MAMEKSSKKTCGKAEENQPGKKQKMEEVRVVGVKNMSWGEVFGRKQQSSGKCI